MNASNPQIYFRIGLKGTIDSDAHRYGIVLLKYKGNTMSQRIWIRQGEGEDYVMRNSDPVSSGGLSERTQCKQFSPYNLTAKEDQMNSSLDVNGGITRHVPVVTADRPTVSLPTLYQVRTSLYNKSYSWGMVAYISSSVSQGYYDSKMGLSIRCVKDN